ALAGTSPAEVAGEAATGLLQRLQHGPAGMGPDRSDRLGSDLGRDRRSGSLPRAAMAGARLAGVRAGADVLSRTVPRPDARPGRAPGAAVGAPEESAGFHMARVCGVWASRGAGDVRGRRRTRSSRNHRARSAAAPGARPSTENF